MQINTEPLASIMDPKINDFTRLANEALHQGKPLEWCQPYLVRAADGEMRVVTTPDAPWDKPHFLEQGLTVIDAQSFIAYLEKHGETDETEIRVYENASQVRAVIDAGSKDTPGHAAHSITLNPRIDDDWQAWTRIDGELMTQQDFADFIEDQALNITSPDAATMLEIATSMQVNTSVEFEQGHRQADGQVRFAYREDSNTRAGANGDIEIPATINIALAPFKGGTVYNVEARLRWRIREKQLRIGVKLVHPNLVREAAFQAIVDDVVAWNTDVDTENGALPRHLLTYH